MKDTTFAVILGVELFLSVNGFRFFSFWGVILAMLIFGICSLLVLGFYFIRLKLHSIQKKDKMNFYKKGVLILFGLCSSIIYGLSIALMLIIKYRL